MDWVNGFTSLLLALGFKKITALTQDSMGGLKNLNTRESYDSIYRVIRVITSYIPNLCFLPFRHALFTGKRKKKICMQKKLSSRNFFFPELWNSIYLENNSYGCCKASCNCSHPISTH